MMKTKSLTLGMALLFFNVREAWAVDFDKVIHEDFSTSSALSNSWADYDNDKDLDLLVTFETGRVNLYQNHKGQFREVGRQLGLPTEGSQIRGAAWGDYNNDGFVDIFLGYADVRSPTENTGQVLAVNRLYKNIEGKKFVNVAKEAGLDSVYVDTRQVSWIDFDGDGDLDLYTAQKSGRNQLFENRQGVFVNIGYQVGLADPRRTVGSCWFDMDQDGDFDLFNANQYGDKDALYRNDNGKFVDIAKDLKIDQPLRQLSEGSIACSVADYDNDGDFDLFVAGIGSSRLYQNDGNGAFSEVAQRLGLAIPVEAGVPASVWGDVDLDGRLDVYIANGFGKDFLYYNTAAGFKNKLPKAMSNNQEVHGAQWADFDMDGDLDLALASQLDPGGHPLFRNQLSAPHTSLQIMVLDSRGHYTKAGAEVRAYSVTSGRLLGSRLVDTGSGHNAQNAMPVFFGFANNEVVDIEVTSIENSVRKAQLFHNIDPGDYQNSWLVLTVQ